MTQELCEPNAIESSTMCPLRSLANMRSDGNTFPDVTDWSGFGELSLSQRQVFREQRVADMHAGLLTTHSHCFVRQKLSCLPD